MRREASLFQPKLLGRLLNISIIIALLLLAGIILKKYYLSDAASPTIGHSAR